MSFLAGIHDKAPLAAEVFISVPEPALGRAI
jgi:hypothetical protein